MYCQPHNQGLTLKFSWIFCCHLSPPRLVMESIPLDGFQGEFHFPTQHLQFWYYPSSNNHGREKWVPPPNSGYLLSTSSCHFHENGGKSSVEGRFCVSHTFSWFAQNPRNVCGSTTPQLSEPCRPGFVVPNFPVSVSIYFFYVKTNPSWHMIHITCSFCSCLVALCVWSVAFLL